MSPVMKRKNEDPANNLHCGFEGLLVKKSKSSGVLKFNMKNKEVKSKVFQILKLLSCHIFATPFLKMENDEVSDKDQQYFDDVLEKVETNKYENSQEAFDDLNDILEETIRTKKKTSPTLTSNRVGIPGMIYSHEDVEIMANQIRKQIHKMQKIFLEKKTSKLKQTQILKSLNKRVIRKNL